MRTWWATGAALVVMGLAGCTDAGSALDDEAACPGETCTDDAQDRYDAVAAVDRVTRVATVARSYGLDRGSSRTAEVSAEVATEAEAVDVGLEVLRVLDTWPDHEGGDALASVTADPAVPVRQVETGEQPLPPEFYEPCRPTRCRAALDDLERAAAALDGVADASAAVDDGVLVLSAVAAEVPAGQAVTAVLDLVETDLDLRVATSVRVEIEHTGPLAVTLRLSEGRVCEQPPGMVVACNSGNSVPLSG